MVCNYWCERWDLNPHGVITSGFWVQCVCQFRHSRMVVSFQFTLTIRLASKKDSNLRITESKSVALPTWFQFTLTKRLAKLWRSVQDLNLRRFWHPDGLANRCHKPLDQRSVYPTEVERITRFEPVTTAWKAIVLPLHYIISIYANHKVSSPLLTGGCGGNRTLVQTASSDEFYCDRFLRLSCHFNLHYPCR